MKKIYAVLIACAVIFTSCPTDDGNGENGGGNNEGGTATTLRIRNLSSKTISEVVWNNVTFFPENADILGTWTGNAGTSGFITGAINLVVGSNTYTMSAGYDNDGGTWARNGNNFTFQSNQPLGYKGTGILSAGKLTLNIQDFMGSYSLGTYELTSNNLDLSINSGANVIKPVEDGLTYIFFRVGTTAYRTSEAITVIKNESAEFNFMDNTIIIDVSDTSKSLTLGSL